MKYLKMLGLAAVVAMAFTAFAASTATATTLEVNGTPKNEALELSGSLESGTSLTLARTDGNLANTCTTSTLAGATEAPFTGTRVTGKVSSLTFGGCTETVTVDNNGQLYVEHIAGTTNGTVFSENAEVTVKTPFGNEVNCRTNAGTDIGTLTGKKTGETATMDINAVLNCGFVLPSATWKGSYLVTSPTGLGVTDEGPPVPTTLEVNGTPKNEALELSGSLESGTSLTLARTDGSLANTCTTSTVEGATSSPFTGTKVTGAVSSLSFGSCSETVTVDKNGSLYVEYTSGTNGTVFSENAEVTVKTPFGNEVNCRTNEGTDIGTLTGKKTGETATMDINAVLNCGFVLPSATWKGSYLVTSPTGLGVTA